MSARSCVGILFPVGAVLLSLLTVSLSAQGAVITHTYDANSRLSTSVSDNGIELAFNYDANGNIGSYTAKGGSGPTAVPDGGFFVVCPICFRNSPGGRFRRKTRMLRRQGEGRGKRVAPEALRQGRSTYRFQGE